jgi:hypothetical protein
MAGLDPAIGYPHQFANDAIPVSNHPMENPPPHPRSTWLRRQSRSLRVPGWLSKRRNVLSRSPNAPRGQQTPMLCRFAAALHFTTHCVGRTPYGHPRTPALHCAADLAPQSQWPTTQLADSFVGQPRITARSRHRGPRYGLASLPCDVPAAVQPPRRRFRPPPTPDRPRSLGPAHSRPTPTLVRHQSWPH